ncbi:NUDIX domain-containing protein [Halobacteria archaeon HArc-gm2]|nr:NUDIX domain-containing protein [Halobacteria archaeon HArc-gm2]
METTRHFTATIYVVHPSDSGDVVALHEHDKHGLWLAPGGHVERDELPHEAGLREVREELGFDVELVADRDALESETTRSLPQPAHVQLADINVTDEGVGHQHVDLIYYAEAPHRDIDPEPGEQPADHWDWITKPELADREEIPPDVTEIGQRAIRTVAES